MSPVVVARIDRRRRLLLTGMAAGLTSVAHAQSLQPGLAVASRPLVLGEIAPVSYTHLTLPTTPYV